jgi:hypothetical protein
VDRFKNFDLSGALSLALAESLATTNLGLESSGNAALITSTAVTVTVIFTFHPTAFAGRVLWEFLAIEAEAFDGGALSGGLTSAGSHEVALAGSASEQRATIGGTGAGALGALHLGCVAGSAELHEVLALPVSLADGRFLACVRRVGAAVLHLADVSGEDAHSHHLTGLRDVVSFGGEHCANNGQKCNGDLHRCGRDCWRADEDEKVNCE